jgi:polyribonucleotide nucleotidyltransferase
MSIATERLARVSVQIGQQEISFETGKLAKQADGAVVVRSGETMVLATAQGRPEAREGADFFPSPSMSRSGCTPPQDPGRLLQARGRPTERAILTARQIDRPIRPLWPKGFRNEVQVICTVLSADMVTGHDILCINGASAALMLSRCRSSARWARCASDRPRTARSSSTDAPGDRGINPRSDRRRHERRPDDGRGRRRRDPGGHDPRGSRAAHREIVKLCEAQEDLQRQAGKAKWLDLELAAELESQHGHTVWERIQQPA